MDKPTLVPTTKRTASQFPRHRCAYLYLETIFKEDMRKSEFCGFSAMDLLKLPLTTAKRGETGFAKNVLSSSHQDKYACTDNFFSMKQTYFLSSLGFVLEYQGH